MTAKRSKSVENKYSADTSLNQRWIIKPNCPTKNNTKRQRANTKLMIESNSLSNLGYFHDFFLKYLSFLLIISINTDYWHKINPNNNKINVKNEISKLFVPFQQTFLTACVLSPFLFNKLWTPCTSAELSLFSLLKRIVNSCLSGNWWQKVRTRWLPTAFITCTVPAKLLYNGSNSDPEIFSSLDIKRSLKNVL